MLDSVYVLDCRPFSLGSSAELVYAEHASWDAKGGVPKWRVAPFDQSESDFSLRCWINYAVLVENRRPLCSVEMSWPWLESVSLRSVPQLLLDLSAEEWRMRVAVLAGLLEAALLKSGGKWTAWIRRATALLWI